MRLSVVSTLYRSEAHLREFVAAAGAAAREITDDFEVVLVNDGSPDGSLDLAKSLQREYPELRVIDLSRNFGHHKAMMTGLAHARGSLVYLTDSDLEEDPRLLGLFHETLVENDADVVYGVQSQRSGGFIKRFGGSVFYGVFNLVSDFKLEPNMVTARLMTRRYVESLLCHQEREVFIAGLWQSTGYKQIALGIHKEHRAGTSYSLMKRVELAVRAITMFTHRPLLWIAYLGAFLLLGSSLVITWLVGIRLFVGHPPDGYTSIIVSLWFLGGLILFSLGIIAIYLSVIFLETKQRPLTIVSAVHESREGTRTGPGNDGVHTGNRHEAVPEVHSHAYQKTPGE